MEQRDEDTELLNESSELCERGFHYRCQDECCECPCHLLNEYGGEG